MIIVMIISESNLGVMVLSIKLRKPTLLCFRTA